MGRPLVEDILNSPYVLIGSTDAIAEAIAARRERHGFSYWGSSRKQWRRLRPWSPGSRAPEGVAAIYGSCDEGCAMAPAVIPDGSPSISTKRLEQPTTDLQLRCVPGEPFLIQPEGGGA
jgi:hypothetical protein